MIGRKGEWFKKKKKKATEGGFVSQIQGSTEERKVGSDELGAGESRWFPKVSSRTVCGFRTCVMLCNEGIRREACSLAKRSLSISRTGQEGVTKE